MKKKLISFSKNKFFTIIIITFTIMLTSNIIVFVLGWGGFLYEGEAEELINKTETNFGFENIKYNEILYFRPFSGGVFGEGDSLLVFNMTDRQAEMFEKKLTQNTKIYTFPMSQEVKIYTYNTMYNEEASFHMRNLKSGYYAYYSKVNEKILSYEEIQQGIRNNINILDRYIYIQYDVDTNVMYIWEYS